MEKQTNDLEVGLLEYSVGSIRTKEQNKTFITSIKTAEKDQKKSIYVRPQIYENNGN